METEEVRLPTDNHGEKSKVSEDRDDSRGEEERTELGPSWRRTAKADKQESASISRRLKVNQNVQKPKPTLLGTR